MTHGSSRVSASRNPRAGTRVHVIHVFSRIRKPSRRLFDGVTLIIVFALFSLLSYVVGSHLLGEDFTGRNTGTTTALVIIIPAGGTIGGAAWAVFLEFVVYRRTRQERLLRRVRLSAIAAHPDATARLPHRLVEQALRRFWRRRPLRRALQAIGPGRVILNLGSINGRPRLPTPAEQRFEPLDLRRDPDRWLALLEQTTGITVGNVSAATTRGEDAAERTQRKRDASRDRLNRMSGWLGTVMAVAFILRDAYGMATAGRHGFTLYGYGGVLTLVVVVRLLIGTRWWLVPGGLICRRHRAWRKHVWASLATPDTTALFVDLNGRIALIHRGRLKQRSVWPFHVWPLIAGWISTTPPPTRDAVLSFVGPDAVWEANA